MLRATRSVPVGASAERASDVLSVMAITYHVDVATWRPRWLPMGPPTGHGQGDARADISSAPSAPWYDWHGQASAAGAFCWRRVPGGVEGDGGAVMSDAPGGRSPWPRHANPNRTFMALLP